MTDHVDATLPGGSGTSAAEPTDGFAPPSAAEMAALAAAAASAIPTPRAPAAEDASIDPAVEQAGTAKKTSGRVSRGRRYVMRVALFAVTLALLAGGAALGAALFQRTQSPPPTIGDASTGGVPTPTIVTTLGDALTRNDAASLRSALTAVPFRLLAGEFQTRGVQSVAAVKTLATMQDGAKSATEIVIDGRTSSGIQIIFNLVVHVDSNQIVEFR